MTVPHTKNEKSLNTHNSIIVFSIFVIIALTFLASSEIRNAIVSGIRLSAFSVIPAIFPFLIISDFLSTTALGERYGLLSRSVKRILGISNAALPAFLYGSICGFPVGIKMASELYNRKTISKSECQRLIGCTSNPSPAFVVSGIGIGIYGNIKHGIILYVSILISSIFVCAVTRENKQFLHKKAENIKQTFSIVNSVKAAALSCVYISSYIIFFSAIIGAASKFVKNDTLLAMITALLEITNASKMLSALIAFSFELRVSLTAFALSFSGLCFALQARSLLPIEISMRKYYLMKLSSGALSFFICYLLLKII